jgi:uncharacterized protein
MTRRLSRRHFLIGGAAAGTAAVAGALYSRFGEPHWLELSRVSVPLSPAGESRPPVRIAHLSDFHSSPVVPLAFIDEAVSLALTERPDAVAITGDFFTNRLRDAAPYADILRRLSAAVPTFACLGNHDGGPWTQRAGGNPSIDEALDLLRAANVTCLQNAGREITLRNRSFQFIGVGDLWSGLCDPPVAFARTPPRAQATRILLNHNPDAKELLHLFDWDLALCGHTHGGQLRLPLFGTPFAPVRDRRYVQGLHRWEKRWLYITRGVGNLHGFRFNCRPEVSVLEIL